ncbi:MAG: hybrid sensor histidine kinase/response regulator [Candidatus Loosdrechtia sp.]|uniref:hybrid sensor histidine kinase/response regulator n=1 Tax=Candidatus Loosdrechtia sp. TaxID=3101272 RepID=UPI003A6C5D6F|nr:MAG: response regulator [Candidatus Jettenia sp. AMX2]
MDKEDSEFLKRILATFKIEVKEHLDAMFSGLLELEKFPPLERQVEIIEDIFRESHSLKGAARAVNDIEVENICQLLESIFAALKRKRLVLFPGLFGVLYRAIDGLAGLTYQEKQDVFDKGWVTVIQHDLRDILEGGIPRQEEFIKKEDITADYSGLQQYMTEEGTAPAEIIQISEKECIDESKQVDSGIRRSESRQSLPGKRSLFIESTVRIATAKLHSVMLQAEEIVSAKLVAVQQVKDLRDIRGMLDQWKNEFSRLRSGIKQVRNQIMQCEVSNRNPEFQDISLQITRFQEFFDWNTAYMKSLEERLLSLLKLSEQEQRSLGSMVDNLLTDTKKLFLLPFSSLLEVFPKVVRELSKDQHKHAELVIKGENIEIDRRILEEMKDPFMHIVRNCIDHGIETPEEREKRGKPVQGKIQIVISQKDSGKVEAIVSDDGKGIDAAKVRSAALKLGIISQEEAKTFNENEILSFIFQSGISTSPIITDISGRGLGLAIVQEKVERLGGIISMETVQGKGTQFKIVLPMTIATFLGILVSTGEHLFVIPTINVEQVVRIKRDGIKTVENRETIQLHGKSISLVRLDDTLELPRKGKKSEDSGFITAVILGTAERRIAFVVDQVLGEQEVLMKGLGKQLSRVRNIAGSNVLGTGKVVPVLNISDLMKSAVKTGISGIAKPVALVEGNTEKKKSVLVVEDSITSRMLLKNILETAGYHVIVTVDGVDAFTTLRTEDVDLVVSDVDMPRMNGFDLTAKIRGEVKFSELPVVLVTALDSREDRERGIDVGANAYIVKSSFDQSNLLEVIRKLI